MASTKVEAGTVVILGGPHRSTWIVYNALKDVAPIRAVVIEGTESTWTFLRRRARRLGWPTVAGQVLFELTVIPWLRLRSRERLREICVTYQLNCTEAPEELVHRVDSVNSDSAIELLQRIRPRVIIINATRILSRRLLSSVPAVFINTHAGITPQFRGVHGGYWALATGQRDQFGVTVHLVDPGIDTGGILAQTRLAPSEKDNFVTYPLLQLAAGLPLLRRAVCDALDNRLVALPPPAGPSRLWSHPTLWGYLWTRLRCGVR